MNRLTQHLRHLKFVDTSGADMSASTGSRLLWLLMIWCASVGLLAVIGLILRLVLKP